ncbi:MAG: aminoacyl-tRNA deacylase [Candidatus Aminicenantales bacterium]
MSADVSLTPAVRVLKDKGAHFEIRLYRYEEHGGTAVAARELGADERAIVKTLVFETDARAPLLVLMRGDREVSLKQLARSLGVKAVTPCSPAAAERHTGYHVGGISPFGTRKKLPVYMERTLTDCPRIWINAGKRGQLAELAPSEILRILKPTLVDAAV